MRNLKGLTQDSNLPAVLVRQLSAEEKQKLISLIQMERASSVEEPALTHFASEKALDKDWLSPEEDEVWGDL
ncbi:MAG: hypothetical protein H6573_11755 [Lewinellaceae bacterium]|nr:hypothetical protein [Phaeodactylibacter sp.]MCB9348164.1 hypothetical protein [Lewinellaceae bacterium]